MEFGVSDPSDVADDIERVLKDGKKDDALINVTVDLWSCAAFAYNLAKKEDDKNRCQFEAAECLVLEAERQGSAMLASHWLNAAIRQLHGLPDKIGGESCAIGWSTFRHEYRTKCQYFQYRLMLMKLLSGCGGK